MNGLWFLLTRSIRARPLRAALTAAAVALGAAAVLGVQVTAGALDGQAARARAAGAGRSALDVRAVAGRGIDDAQIGALAAVPGVAELGPLDEKRVAARAADAGTVEAVTVTLVGVGPGGEAGLRPVALLRGRLPDPASRSDVAVDGGVLDALGAMAAHRLDLGGVIELTTASGPDRFTVVGVTAGTAGGPAFTRSAAFVGDAEMRGAFAEGLRTPLVALRLAPGADPRAVRSAAASALGSVVTVDDPRGAGSAPLAQLRPLLLMVTALSVVIGAGVTANSVALGATERRREIGLLRAAGASRRQVGRLLVGEAVVVAATGAVAGVGLGLLLGAALVHLLAPADLGTPDLAVSPWWMLAALVTGMGAGVAGAVVPAALAQRMPPLSALRASPEGTRERRPRLLLVAVPALAAASLAGLAAGQDWSVALGVAALLGAGAGLLPAVAPAVARGLAWMASPLFPSARLAAANLARRRNRTGLTAAALATGVAAATGLSALTAGALQAGDVWIDHLFVGSQVLTSPATANDVVAEDIATREGVTVSRLRFLGAAVDGGVVGLAVIDPGPYRDGGALDFVAGDRGSALEALRTQASVVVPAGVAAETGWHVGSRLEVATATGARPFTVAGVVAHSFPSGDGREALLVGHDPAVAAFGDVASGFDDLQVVDAGQAASDRVAAAAGAYGLRVTTVADIRDAGRAALRHSVALLGALSWVAVTVAMLGVVNTLLVNVRQGTRDLALLRAVGLSRRAALRLVLAEAALLALTGAVAGAGLGCLVALPMLRASSSTAFSPGFVVPLATAAAAAAAVVVGSVVAVLPAARRSAASSIVGAIRGA